METEVAGGIAMALVLGAFAFAAMGPLGIFTFLLMLAACISVMLWPLAGIFVATLPPALVLLGAVVAVVAIAPPNTRIASWRDKLLYVDPPRR